MPAGQPVVAFEVERREDLAGPDASTKTGGDGLQRPDDRVAERVAALVPRAVARRGGHPLDVGRQHVRALGGAVHEGWVGKGRDRRLDDELIGERAVLGGIEHALERIDAGHPHEDPAAQQAGIVGGRGECREAIKDEVDLGR